MGITPRGIVFPETHATANPLSDVVALANTVDTAIQQRCYIAGNNAPNIANPNTAGQAFAVVELDFTGWTVDYVDLIAFIGGSFIEVPVVSGAQMSVIWAWGTPSMVPAINGPFLHTAVTAWRRAEQPAQFFVVANVKTNSTNCMFYAPTLAVLALGR